MGSLKLNARKLSKCIDHVGGQVFLTTSTWRPRGLFTSTRSLQKSKSDKEVKEICEKVIEAADAVKEGAQNVSEMSKVVSEKVTESAEAVIDKAKDRVLKDATQNMKDNFFDK